MKGSKEDNKRFAALDVEFHLSVARASGNPLLLDMISMIRGQLVRGLSRVLSTPNAMPLSLKEHLRIVEAIRVRDPDTASEEMSHHLKSGLARYRSFHTGVTISDVSKTPAVKRAMGRSKKRNIRLTRDSEEEIATPGLAGPSYNFKQPVSTGCRPKPGWERAR
jgi:hypothetical protein